MAAMSDYLESTIIQHIFRSATWTKPTTLAIALCSAAPSDTDTGALTSKEIGNSGAYARVTLNPGTANWADVTTNNGTTSNSSAITFTAASADWGTVTHVAIVDSATYGSGNMLFYGALTASKIVGNGDTFQFAVNQLTVQIDN